MALADNISNAEYIMKYFNKIDLDNWKDNVWWEKEEWKKFIPIEEYYRVFTKYYSQACINKYNKYKKAHGNHFVEILEMIELQNDGYKWLYDNYKLFKNPGPTSKVYLPGTIIIKQIIGDKKINKLHEIVSESQLNPAEPDLFAYKDHNLIFIEAKRGKDKLSKNQLIGIDLIHKYLKIPIKVVHYFER